MLGGPVSSGPALEQCPKGGQHSAAFIGLWVQLVVRAGVSMRGVAAVLELVGEYTGHTFPIPHVTTGRGWLLRLGLAELVKPLEQADDWVLFADHSVQIGSQKLFVITGVRAAHQPPAGLALQLGDQQLIGLAPMTDSNAASVQAELERATVRIGIPRAIVSDQGSDVKSGVARFCEAHPETLAISDIAHRAACLLKPRFEQDERWARFVKLAGQTKAQVAQTELAGIRPPSLRTKARFMNVDPLITWGIKAHRLLVRCRTRHAPAGMTVARVEEKLQWLNEFADALREWREWMQVKDVALTVVRRQGHSTHTPDLLDRAQPRPLAHSSSSELADQFLAFVTEQSAPLRPGERLPGSSEVLESTFGKFKTLERDQSQGGFSSLILSLGTILSQSRNTLTDTITQGLDTTIKHGMELCGIKRVVQWLAQNLGPTVSSQRNTAFNND